MSSKSRFIITNGWRLLWLVRQMTLGRITMIDSGPGRWTFAKNYHSKVRRFDVTFELQRAGAEAEPVKCEQMDLFDIPF